MIDVKVWQASEPRSVVEEDATEWHEENGVQHGTDVVSTSWQQFQFDVHRQCVVLHWPTKSCSQPPLWCKNPVTCNNLDNSGNCIDVREKSWEKYIREALPTFLEKSGNLVWSAEWSTWTCYLIHTGSISSANALLSCAESKVNTDIAVRNRNYHTATGNHMPCGITQCYLPPGRGDFLTFTPAEAGTRFSDFGGLQGWVDLGGGYIPR